MITAAPGIYLAIPIEEKVTINLGKSPEKKLLKGKIISVGANRDHDKGGKLISTYKKGDIVYFISYAENYDWFEEKIDGVLTKIYAVIFNDCRALVK